MDNLKNILKIISITSRRLIIMLMILLTLIVLTVGNSNNIYTQSVNMSRLDAGQEYTSVEKDGLLVKASEINTSGFYDDIEINGVLEDSTQVTEKYNIHAIVYNGDLVLDGENDVVGATLKNNVYEFGDSSSDVATETEYAKYTVLLKVNGNLTINSDVTVTACKSDNGFGGPKGMFIYCTGDLINEGKISMTARGARAEGQNVFLLKNGNESFEYIPSEGAAGANRPSISVSAAPIRGGDGVSAAKRATGGGAAGGAVSGYGTLTYGGKGSRGTSYSRRKRRRRWLQRRSWI